jgi:type III secretory pathway component EscV
MQAISKNRHGHLRDALAHMEVLLAGDGQEFACLQQATDYSLELEAMYRNYERLLKELSEQITAYEILYSEVKVQFLGRKLKELKKQIPAEKPAF